MSLRTKLAGGLAALFLVVGFAVGTASLWGFDSYSDEVRHRLNRDVAHHIAESLEPFAGEAVDKDALKMLFMSVMTINPSLEVYLIDERGKILAYDAPDEKIVRRRVALQPISKFLRAAGEELQYGDDPRSAFGKKPISVHPVTAGGVARGYLYIILGGEAHESAAAALSGSYVIRLVAVLIAGCLLAGGLAGLIAIGFLTRPLRELRRAVKRFRNGGRSVSVPVRAGDEVGALSRDFNEMAQRISDQVRELEDNDENRRAFVANISHDLRTPAAAIQGYLETLLVRDERMDPSERQRYVTSALRQGKRLCKLIDQLFELAGLEARETLPDTEDVSLAELVQDVIHKFQATAERKGVSLESEFSLELPAVRADIGLIERAIDNLIENAIRHTQANKHVVVGLRERADGVEVRVRDEGPGIAEAELETIFDRFYRGDNRPDSVSGAGLGLAITNRIVELHEGEIDVESELGAGSTFSFVLQTAGPGESAERIWN